MSTVERATVVANHKAKALEGDPLHKKIAERIKAVEAAKSVNKKTGSLKRLDQYTAKKGTKKALEYFWDYNTVEAVLLACSILVCLAGVMFESDRFADTPDGKPSKHAWQRDVITFFTLAIVFLSLIYYMTVFLSETGMLQLDCLVKLFADKKKAIHRQQDRNKNGIDDQIELSANPMMQSMQQSEEMKDTQDQLEGMAQAAALLKEQLKAQKKLAQQSSAKGGRGKKTRSGKNKKKQRKGFGSSQVKSEECDIPDGGNEIELVLSDFATTPANNSTGKRKSFKKLSTETGDIYYQDESTGLTSWDKPPDGAIIIDEASAESVDKKKRGTKKSKGKGRAAAAAKRQSSMSQINVNFNTAASADMSVYSTAQKNIEPLPEGWDELEDGSGRKYYANQHSRETSWIRPAESGAEGDSTFSLDNPLGQ